MMKMYKQPESSVEELMPMSICNVSPTVSHEQTEPGTGIE